MTTRWEAEVWIVLVLLACGLLSLPATATAQKTLALDPDLLANSDALKVRLGVQTPGRMWKFKFGEYALVSSKMGAEVTTTSSIFNPVEKSRAKQKFSFVIKGTGPETATVKAAQNLASEALSEFAVSSRLSVSAVDISGTDDNLAATIVLDGDGETPWTLILNVKSHWAVLKEETRAAFLTNGTREIAIAPVTSNAPGAKSSGKPALGYEFSEEGRVLGAVQYWGGGILGSNKNVIYLRRDLEPRTRLLLAAAMTAIIQAKMDALGALD
ncbi:MAG TPA: hypothetical protein VLJ16_14095 [Acidobacteriota bacterium]|nr:hypothetical protein [Acidobacteriota bacterium]